MDATAVTECVVVQMPVDAIDAAHFNPPDRVNENSPKLRDLAALISQYGVLAPLHMSITDNCLADGHRRLAAAKKAGLTHVPVIWHPYTAAELWAILNGATEPISGRYWWQAAAREIAVAIKAPRYMSKRLACLLRILGQEDDEEMAQRRSPEIFTAAVRVANYVGQRKNDEFLHACLLWLDKHDQQRPIIDALKGGEKPSPRAIENAISEDRPLRVRKVYE